MDEQVKNIIALRLAITPSRAKGNKFAKTLFLFTYPVIFHRLVQPIINYPDLLDSPSISIRWASLALKSAQKATQVEAQLMEQEERG